MVAGYYKRNNKVLQRKNLVRFEDLFEEKKVENVNMLVNGI